MSSYLNGLFRQTGISDSTHSKCLLSSIRKPPALILSRNRALAYILVIYKAQEFPMFFGSRMG
jgi:hypothetical protein